MLRRQAEAAQQVLSLNEQIAKACIGPQAPGGPMAGPTGNVEPSLRPSQAPRAKQDHQTSKLQAAGEKSSDSGSRRLKREEDSLRVQSAKRDGQKQSSVSWQDSPNHDSLRQPLLGSRTRSDNTKASQEATFLDKVQGEWVCDAKQLFSGAVIEFTPIGWRPRKISLPGSSHEWIVHDDHIDLIETIQDGESRTFQVSPVPDSDDMLSVSLEYQGSAETWTLKRIRGHSASMSGVINNSFQRRVAKLIKKDSMPRMPPSLYSDSGCCVTVAKSNWFANVSLLVILANTLWIAVDTDNNTADFLDEAPLIFQLAGNAFCALFVVELLVRLLALKRKCDALRDVWFMFDVFLVALMVWETWILVFLHVAFNVGGSGGFWRGSSVLRVFRLLRLTRVARTVRLFKWMPELLVVIKGLSVAMRSVTCTLILLLMVTYVFAVLFTQLLGPSSTTGVSVLDGEFRTVPWAMHNLLMQVFCGFDAELITKMLSIGWEFYLLYLLYLLLGSLTILNLLIGVLCDVVSGVSSEEKVRASDEDLDRRINDMLNQLDADSTGGVEEVEFMELMNTPEVLRELQDFGVDVVAFMDAIKFIYMDTDDLSKEDFAEMVKQFRGDKVATVKDLVDVRKFITMELRNL